MFLTGTGSAARDLRHKGPSGFRVTGVYQDDDCAIVGLDHGGPSSARRTPHQSLPRGPSGAVTLFSGALYNGTDLAVALGLDPSLSPSLLADAAIERWGTEGLSRLNGDYTLARWHPGQRSLLLAACPMGLGSLYHAATPDGILAAGRPSWLLAFPEVDTEPDVDTLALRLTKMDNRIGDRTPWRHIKHLQPGQYLEWRDGATRIAPFWSPVPRRTLRLRRDTEYVEAAREHLDRAVAARCPKGTPILCLLSAGLDSPGVVATAARYHDAPIHTLTIRADATVPLLEPDAGQFRDEWERLQPFRDRYPTLTAHLTEAALPDLALETPGGVLQSRDWPVKRLHQANWFIDAINRTVREQGISTLLAGDAGNVTLSYNGRCVVADQLRAGRWLSAWRNLIPYRNDWTGRPRALWSQGLLPLLSPTMRRLVRRARGKREFRWQEWSSIRPEVAERLQLLDEHDRPQVLTGSLDMDLHIHSVEGQRQNNSRYAHLFQNPGWSWRDPYTDLALVEFCLSLPRDQFRRDGVNRLLARRTLADRVPDTILNERGMGLQHTDWYGWMSQRRDWMAAEIDRIERSPLACSILDTRDMRAILDAWPATVEEAGHLATALRLRKGLGEALRVGQFILMQEGRNE